MSIILDTSAYNARTGRVPPKKGAVKATFQVGTGTHSFEGGSFASTVNQAKELARAIGGINTIALESISR